MFFEKKINIKKILKIAFVFAGIFFITSCGKNNQSAVTDGAVSGKSVAYMVGVIKSIDKSKSAITFYNTGYDGEEILTYSLATEILSKNNRDMTIDEIEPGEVYNVFTDKKTNRITKLKEPDNITEVEDAKVLVDGDEKRLTVLDLNYAYSDSMVVMSNGKQIDPMEITVNDRVTFRGVKGKAYSVVVTKGHGYIRPTNYNDFIDGTLTIKGESIMPVSAGMLLVVPEGTQNISFLKGVMTSETSVVVKRGKVTEVDVSKFVKQDKNTARVKFNIKPQGAELYVDGELRNSEDYVTLRFGNHSIKVTLEGYEEYTGILHVKDVSPTISINLAESKAVVEDEDKDKKDDTKKESKISDSNTKNTSDSSTEDDEDEKSVDTDNSHQITISAPDGAKVYVNGAYKGDAPCSFTKVLGEVTLTLTKTGCETKSYSITVADDGLDVNWSFPDLDDKSVG